MYFWDIERLKSDLRKGPLPASESVVYLIPLIALQFVLGLALPRAAPPVHGDAYATLQAAFWAWGIRGAYVANGGPNGIDFIARLLALWQVHTIRFVIAIGLPVLLLIALVIGPTLAGLISEVSPSLVKDTRFLATAGTILGLAIGVPMLVWYWLRLHAHFRSLQLQTSGQEEPAKTHPHDHGG